MSHFTVLVIGEDHEKQLQPFHEFECTGENDEFVQEIDVTAEAKKNYEKDKTTKYKDPDGKLYDTYLDQFYREPTEEETKKIGLGSGCSGDLSWSSKDWGDGKGYRAKVHFRPKGWKQVEVKKKDVMTFREFVEDYYGEKREVPFGKKPDLSDNSKHKYGYTLLDKKGDVLKVVDRTNPNSKWDWYQVGGRWRGFFTLKRKRALEVVGKPGVPELFSGKIEEMPDNVADQAYKRDIDIQEMRDKSADEAAKRYDQLARICGGNVPVLEKTWKKLTEGDVKDWDAKRKEYHSQPAMKKIEELKKNKDLSKEDRDLLVWLNLDEYQGGRDAYIGRAIRNAICTFAVVKDGKWYERGEMGWWGAVSDEKDEAEWADQFHKLLDSVPDDTLLTVVDCHI